MEAVIYLLNSCLLAAAIFLVAIIFANWETVLKYIRRINKMTSKRKVELQYKLMVARNSSDVDPDRVNCYKCPACGHITKTKDVDVGVTPFMKRCEKCDEFAYSSFYNDIAPDQEPTIEWYRPSLEEVLEIKDEGILEHVLKGGLECRKIN